MDEDSQLQKQLKPSKRQRDLEHLARTYLHDIGKNVTDTQPYIVHTCTCVCSVVMIITHYNMHGRLPGIQCVSRTLKHGRCFSLTITYMGTYLGWKLYTLTW